RVVPEQGEAFWSVLVRHGVAAYLCSHIIAFDVQVHQDVLQITTGGAGTEAGPGGFMPGATEYLHLVQMACDHQGLRYQVLDTVGELRESLTWPLQLPPVAEWKSLSPATIQEQLSTARANSWPGRDRVCGWHFSGTLKQGDQPLEAQTLLCGWDLIEA